MPVVRFDNFDVGIVAHHLRRLLQQLQQDIDANAKVSGEDNGNVLRGIANRLFASVVKTGGADDHPFAVLAAKRQMVQRAFRAGKID